MFYRLKEIVQAISWSIKSSVPVMVTTKRGGEIAYMYEEDIQSEYIAKHGKLQVITTGHDGYIATTAYVNYVHPLALYRPINLVNGKDFRIRMACVACDNITRRKMRSVHRATLEDLGEIRDFALAHYSERILSA